VRLTHPKHLRNPGQDLAAGRRPGVARIESPRDDRVERGAGTRLHLVVARPGSRLTAPKPAPTSATSWSCGAGDGGEGAEFWLAALTEIKNRGTADVCIVVCDGLKGLPEAVNTVWDRAVIQICVIHLLRNMFRYASRKYWDQIAKDIRPVYTAATEAAAKERFVEFTTKWGAQYPAIIRLWENAWSAFVPFLDYDVEIRRVICSTNAVESINARYRRAIRARGHFPTE
jgi:hypothetical protein